MERTDNSDVGGKLPEEAKGAEEVGNTGTDSTQIGNDLGGNTSGQNGMVEEEQLRSDTVQNGESYTSGTGDGIQEQSTDSDRGNVRESKGDVVLKCIILSLYLTPKLTPTVIKNNVT